MHIEFPGHVGKLVGGFRWGDQDQAGEVLQVVRDNVLPFKPDYVFTGHDSQREGMEFLADLVQRMEAALHTP